MKNNGYYSIACNELLYLQENLGTVYYNSVVTGAQQITEKLLKSVVERVTVTEEQLMHSHNLRGLYSVIHSELPDFQLNRDALSTLKDYYYDCRYPGYNYCEVTQEECEAALKTMYDTWEQTNRFRESLGLSVFPYEAKMLKKS